MVTNNHYRWDFIGLSTDEKPTPDTSDKVVDGSTFYCSDTSKLYVFCKSNWYERKPLGSGGGGGGTSYTAGVGITIADDTISVDTTTIQEKLTAGTGIDITDNTISATGGGGDTVYSDKSTSNSTTGGAVYIGNLDSNQQEQPDPTTTDNHYKYYWALPTSNNAIPTDSSINLLGNSADNYGITIGAGAYNTSGKYYSVIIGSSAYSNDHSVTAIGFQANGRAENSIAIGRGATVNTSTYKNSIALGSYASVSRKGELNVGTGGQNQGYNNTDYRVLGGVHDGQLAQDAVTVNQVNSVIDAINTALSTNISHIGA